MTPVNFHFQLPDGTPCANAPFTVFLRRAGFNEGDDEGIAIPGAIEAVTDADGKKTIELMSLNQPYYVEMLNAESSVDACSYSARYRFYVPVSDVPVDLETLLITDPTWSQKWDEIALQVITDAKAASIAAADRSEAEADRAKQEADRAALSADDTEADALRAETAANNAVLARDASEAYAVRAAASAQETDADRIASQQAVVDARQAATESDASADAAALSQDAAAQSATAANASAVEATARADEAEASAAAALSEKTQAVAAKDAAVVAKDQSVAAKDASAASATASLASETKAKAWATNPEDVPVDPGLFSAMHWAKKAEAIGGGMPAQIASLTDETRSKAQQGAKQENFSANYAARYDLLDVNGSSVIRGCQAFCFDEVNRHMYITEGGAISRYPMDGDVGVNTLDTTGVGGTALGHQGLAVEYLPSTRNIKLWTTSATVGRAALRFDYVAGTPVTAGEVYELFPQGAYADSTSCTPTVSHCNRYLLAHGTVFGQVANTMIRVFRIADLLAHGPGDCTGLALHEWPTQQILVDANNPFQGLACDGQNVYGIAGGTGFTPDVNKRLCVYTLEGKLLQQDLAIDIGQAIAATDGDGTRYEPEGLSLVSAPGGGLSLMVGILSGQPSQRRFRIYGTGMKKPVITQSLRLLDNVGSTFFSAVVGISNVAPEGAVSGVPGDLLLTKLGKAFIKKAAGVTGWGELMDRDASLALIQSFGLGTTGNLNFSTDLNAWRTTATFVINADSALAAGLPIGTVGHVISHIAGTVANGHTQWATPMTSVVANKNRVFHRQMWAGTWSNWQEVAYVEDAPVYVRATVLTGYAVGANSALAATDTVLAAMGKIQGQLNAKLNLAGGKMSGAFNEAPVTTIAAAATIDLENAASNTVHLTGTASISSFGSGTSGTRRLLRNLGTITLVHSANLQMPGQKNLALGSNDCVEAVCFGGSTWVVVSYNPSNGIVESGSNANGNYIKYGDGTMHCLGTSLFPAGPINQQGSVNNSFALAFLNTPLVLYSAMTSEGSGSQADTGSNMANGMYYTAVQSGFTLSSYRYRYGTDFPVRYSYLAIGRWK